MELHEHGLGAVVGTCLCGTNHFSLFMFLRLLLSRFVLPLLFNWCSVSVFYFRTCMFLVRTPSMYDPLLHLLPLELYLSFFIYKWWKSLVWVAWIGFSFINLIYLHFESWIIHNDRFHNLTLEKRVTLYI